MTHDALPGTHGGLRTIALLGEIGWVPDNAPTATPGQMRVEAPGFWLTALECLNMAAKPIVLVCGAHVTRRTMKEIIFELPREVGSKPELQELIVRRMRDL